MFGDKRRYEEMPLSKAHRMGEAEFCERAILRLQGSISRVWMRSEGTTACASPRAIDPLNPIATLGHVDNVGKRAIPKRRRGFI